MNIAQLRKQYAGFSDDEIAQAVQEAHYPDFSVQEVKDALGIKPPKRSLLAVANDTVIEAANAAAGGVSAAASFVAPGNRFSKFIEDEIVKAGEAAQSDAVKAEKAKLRTELEAAAGMKDEALAALRYVVRNPALAVAQAAGSFAGPGLAIKGAQGAALAARLGAKAAGNTALGAGAVVGGAMAGGDAAQQAYELAIKAGATEEEATAAARQASAIPGAIGAAGSFMGAERLLAGAKGFSGGALSRAAKTGLSEAAQEGIEEGATQYEGQRAALPFDPKIDPMKGVAGAATLGAALGGITGAGTSLLTRHDADAAEVAAAGAQLRAADAAFDQIGPAGTVDEAIAATTAATRVPLVVPSAADIERPAAVLPIPVGEASELVPEEVDPAGGPGSISMRQRIQERRARRDVPPVGETTELGLAEAAALSGPLSRETQVRPVPTGQAIELGLEEVEPAPPLTTPEPPARAPRTSQPSEQEAFRQRQQQEADAVVAGVIDGLRKVNTMQARAYVQDFDAGRVTRQDVLDLVKWKPAAPPQPVNAQERLEQASAIGALAQQKRDETALLLTADGMPYGTRASAVARASREGGGDVIEVAGGWAVRPQGASDAQQVSGAGVPAPAADGGVRLGADAAGGERAPAGVPVPDPGARQPAFSGQPDVAVADAGGPDAALSGFTDGMSQTRAGAVRMTLRAPAGQPFGRRSRQEVVQEMVADGATVVRGGQGQRILRAGNVAVEEAMLNRTALDYAEHLIARRGESQAQAKPAPAAEREEGRQPEGERDGQEGLQAGQGRREEVTPPAQDAAAVPSGSSAAAAPAPEADGPRVFQKGDRVVIGGTLSTAGRHGEVTDVSVLRMRSMFGGKETVSRHYTVKTDAGAIAHASDDNVQPETGEAPAVVPDVKVGDVWMTPEDAEASAKAARASQRRYEGAKMRARTAASKAEHQKDIDRYKEAADRAEEALEAWRREHGDEEAAAATDAAPPAVDGFTLKKTKHGKTGADLWVVQMDKRVDRDEYDRIAAKAKAAGGKWSKFSKGFEFGTEGGANDFLRGMAPAQAPAAAPAPAPEPSRPPAPAPAPLPAPPAPRERPATTPNRLVSEDAAARARERLRQKLGRLQAGVDPEMLQDGIILAAYHVENGARKFAAYAKAMVADLGDAVRPYLQSWYLALRADPTYSSLRDGMDKAGMVDDLTAEQIDGMLADGEQAAPEPERPPAPAKARERTETPAPPPTVDPFAGNYDALVGKTITRTFTLDDGTTATMQVDAAEALRDIDRRAKAVKDLRACLRGAG